MDELTRRKAPTSYTHRLFLVVRLASQSIIHQFSLISASWCLERLWSPDLMVNIRSCGLFCLFYFVILLNGDIWRLYTKDTYFTSQQYYCFSFFSICWTWSCYLTFGHRPGLWGWSDTQGWRFWWVTSCFERYDAPTQWSHTLLVFIVFLENLQFQHRSRIIRHLVLCLAIHMVYFFYFHNSVNASKLSYEIFWKIRRSWSPLALNAFMVIIFTKTLQLP